MDQSLNHWQQSFLEFQLYGILALQMQGFQIKFVALDGHLAASSLQLLGMAPLK
jgi:hypothetical protein